MRIPILNDLLIALSLLTRLPVPYADWSDQTRPAARAAWAYPLAGLVIGGLSATVAWVALWIGLPPTIAALLLVVTSIVTTGAMHEDGLADCADGFWGGWERARRLDIMKDSAIGTYGVLALITSVAARWMIYALLFIDGTWPFWAFILPAILSRTSIVGVMQALPPARDSGLSVSTGTPGPLSATGAIAIGVAATCLLPIPLIIPVICGAIAAPAAACLIARSKIGGQTGDVLGATQQLTEIAILIAISAAL